MKSFKFIPIFLAAALSAQAYPFGSKSVPGGFSASTKWGEYQPASSLCRDFAQAGYNQWYFGGETLRRFPGASTWTLPVITLAANLSATPRPMSFALLDADRDGDTDIVRAVDWNHNSIHSLVVYLNQGSGSFTVGFRRDWTESVPYDEGEHFIQLVTGDFNRDGGDDVGMLRTYFRYDLAQSNYPARGYPTIWWNDGSGGFGSQTDIDGRGFSRESNLVVGDTDRDGDLDLICNDWVYVDGNEDWHQYLRFYENDGAGTFSITSVEKPRWNLTLPDVNRDSWPDLVTVNTNGPVVALNAKDGTFPAETGTGVSNTGLYATGDLDEDGIDDLVSSPAFSGSLVWSKGTGSGSFGAAQALANYATPIVAITVADAEPDGDMDILLQTESGWFLQENTASHRTPALTRPSSGASFSLAGVTQLAAGDFNRDGRDDVVAVTPSQEKLWLYPMDAAGNATAPVFKSTQSEAPGKVATGDFDRDGRMELAYTLPATGDVRLTRNNSSSFTLWADSSIGNVPGVSLIATGEMGTYSGRTDILVSSSTTGMVRWYYQSGASWAYQTVRSTTSPVPAWLAPANTLTARPGEEVFCTALNSTSMRVYGWQLNPSWVAAADYTDTMTAPPGSAAMLWADVVPGGRREAVFINGSGKLVSWSPAIGSTTSSIIGTPEGYVNDLKAVDWNRDGREDILCATATGLCLFYKPEFTWLKRMLTGAPLGGYTSVVTGDFDRDGFPDAAASTNSGVEFFRNNSALAEYSETAAPVVMTEGTEDTVHEGTVTNAGRDPALFTDAFAERELSVEQATLSFRRAVQSGGQWVAGSALTATEFSQLIASVKLVTGNVTIGASGPGLYSAGLMPINYNSAFGTRRIITPSSQQQIGFRLTLTASAAQASVTRFYVSLSTLKVTQLHVTPALVEFALPAGTPAASLVSVVPDLTPLQQWRQDHFGTPNSTGSAANNADPDGDGMANLMEYINGQDPNVRGGLGFGPVVGVSLDAGRDAMVADLRLLSTYDSKVKLTLQYTFNPAAGWNLLSTRTGTGAWTGITPYTTTPLSGGRTRFGFDGGFNPAIFKKTFFRLKAEELP